MANPIAHRQRSWLKDNFIGMILLAVVGIYFTYDIKSKSDNREDHQEFTKSIGDLQAISYNLVQTYNAKCSKDVEQDKEILELWKSVPRSGNSRNTIIK